MRSRASFLGEMLLLGGALLALLVWIIPAQTSEGGFGLSPAFLPTALTVALLVLVLGDGALRLFAGREELAYPEGYGALWRILAVTVLGALVLRFGGVALAGAVTSAAGLLVLGERRPLPLVATTVLCGGILWFVFG